MTRKTFPILVALAVAAAALPALAKGPQLQLYISKDDVSLENRTLTFKLNRPCASAQVQVFDLAGDMLTETFAEYNGAAAGTPLTIQWKEIFNGIGRIELKATDTTEFWVAWEIVPFAVEIPHEEVIFETGKADILPAEAPKLDAALALLLKAIAEHGKDLDCQVYVAGFTDTVDTVSYNRELSLQRARSIARYFVQHGLKKIPIYVRGFGEEVPAVKTGDGVAEPRNRRAVYILGVVPPAISGPGSWSRLQ